MKVKIKVTPEGREDVYIPEKDSLKAWIKSKKLSKIHHFFANGSMFIGADHDVEDVLQDIDKAERIGLCIGVNHNAQMGHELSVVIGNQLNIFDIGRVGKEDIEVV